MKKNKIKIAVLLFTLVFALCATALASSSTFDKTGESNFGPDTGSLVATFYSSYAKTYLSFRYSSDDATAIANYNANGFKRYFGPAY